MTTNINTTNISTVIIGAGQAGLATAYHLTRRGRDCVVLDAADRIGDGWRRQWDTLRLYSPAKYDALPGLAFPAPPWSYPSKDQVGDYLETYAQHFELPVRLGVRVTRVEQDGDGYRVTTSLGDFRCDNVVVATGTFGRTPMIPEFADQLDPGILQLHSSEYRRPGQVQDGPVLVVGGSHSGCYSAYELAQTHTTMLAGRDPGQIPFRLETRTARFMFPILIRVWRHVLNRRTPIGRKLLGEFRTHGGPMLRVKRSDLIDRGVERVHERFDGVENGLPTVGAQARDVRTVVWATGFKQRFDWIKLPILGDDGWPREFRGVSADAPGLFFVGLCFQFGFTSMLMSGAGPDSAYVVDRILARATSSRVAA
jgi:putative flavoprotein involved in K+ transport